MKNIDIKSFLIGFFLATTILLAIGASKETQDVRIVGIDEKFGDWDAISVKTK
jgi:preprotein translocase subunit SecG